MKRSLTRKTCTRRRVLEATGAGLLASASATGVGATGGDETTAESSDGHHESANGRTEGSQTTHGEAETTTADDRTIVAENDGQTYTVEPLTGEMTVTELYHYQLPQKYVSEENGASDDGGLYYIPTGLEDIPRDDTTVTFLYDGPEGLSLVVVHDRRGESQYGGGAVTWTVTGLPEDGRWVVKDDLYRNPETGEIAETNYDNWNLSGSVDVIDWTWGPKNVDGGAFRGLGDEFDVTIESAFNEEAALFGEIYEGRIVDWQLLSGDLSNPNRIDLCREDSLSISTTE